MKKTVTLVPVDDAFDRYLSPEEKRAMDERIEKAIMELKKVADAKRKKRFIKAFLKR